MDSNAVVLDISSDDESGSEDYKWISELLNGEVRENDDSDDVVVVVSEVMSTWNSKSDNDDDCVILDDDPDKPVSVVVDAASWSDELLVVGEKGKIACRDYPHPRHICAKFPFGTTPHETHCDQCHCYVCDSLAPCVYWEISNSIIDHCHATDKEETWKLERKNAKLGKSDSLPVLKLPHTSLSMNQVLPPVHYYSLPRNPVYRSTVISPCSSSSSSSSSRVLFGTMAQEKRFVGVVCWFNDAKGFGFITPSFGDEDLFVHQSAILSDGYRSLNQGDTVKFAIVDGNNGRKQAVDVTISDVSFIEINRKDRNSGGRRNNRRGSSYGGFNGGLRSSDRGRIGGESYSGGGDCFNCGEVGHMAWDCGNNVGVDGSGDGGVECNDFDQIGHISGDCRQENCSGGVTTVRTCYTCGQLGHMARKCTNGSGDRGSVGGGRDVGCYTCGQSGHVASDCTNVSGSGGACHNCGEIGHFWRDCHEERSSERYGGGFSSHGGVNSGSGGRACHNCGKIGHLSRECHEGRSSERYGGGFSSHGGFNSGGGGGGGGACHNCGKIGHFSRDCHEERSERYGRHSGGGRVCYYCGQEGHIARECPYIS